MSLACSHTEEREEGRRTEDAEGHGRRILVETKISGVENASEKLDLESGKKTMRELTIKTPSEGRSELVGDGGQKKTLKEEGGE